MERLYRLSIADISIAGAAMDYILQTPVLLKGVPPEKQVQMRKTRDLFEQYNSENTHLYLEVPSK